MKIPAEFAQELAAFPAALRKLVETEIEAGNTIAELTHGFPAAPCGANVKLAKHVGPSRRVSSECINFYERNMPDYSGEFTDAQRHFFVLEPPNPPQPYPDMDAIRKAAEGMPDALAQFAQTRETGSGLEIGAKLLRERSIEAADELASAPRRALMSTETATSARRTLHFRDRRPPHEIQFALERDLMTLFVPTMENGCLTVRAQANVVGGLYFFELRFEAALVLKNCYSLCVETSWAERAETHHDYYRKTSDSWFSLWTRDFMASNPPAANAGCAARYQKLCDVALRAEAHLDTIQALQKSIVAAMKRGASFATSHKEGGTNICWTSGRFVRTDHGDYPGQQKFSSEADFLIALRQFYDWETSKNIYPNKVSEFEAWKLILRLLRTS